MNNKQQAYKLLYGNLWQANVAKLQKINPNAIPGKSFAEKNFPTKNIITDENKIEVKMNNAALLMNPLEINQPNNIQNINIKEIQKKHAPILLTNINTEIIKPIANINNSNNMILNWDELAETVRQCNNCNLCYGRKNTVFERGNRNAKWMFIGEAPSEAEDLSATPFVGASGELLDKMITAMQLDSQNDVYICNVVKCRPAYNKNIEASEMDSCRNYILSQIELVKPQIIITLGRFASLSLLGSDLATAKLRGKEYKFKGIPLIVTYHPSYLLRNPEAKKDTWQDLQFAINVFAKSQLV